MKITREWRGWGVACLGLALTGCGDGPLGVSAGFVASLAVVSGDDQPGRAGHDLPEPLVVRATNVWGRGVPGVTVTWTVEAGEGAFDGRFEMPRCPPLGTARTRTDPEGFARVSFMPTWFGPSTVVATVTGLGGPPAAFTTDASDPGAGLTILDGENQQGKTGEPLPLPMWVVVTDGNGAPVPNVSVSWTTPADRGTLLGGCPWTTSWHGARTTQRLPDDPYAGLYGQLGGHSIMIFRPGDFALGATTVTAAVPGADASTVTFAVETTTMVIPLFHGWLGSVYFRGPLIAPVFTVPLGTTVEFRNDVDSSRLEFARIVSTSTPPGGEAFDSGELTTGERFTFVPQVSGTWLFVDEVSGAGGELVVV